MSPDPNAPIVRFDGEYAWLSNFWPCQGLETCEVWNGFGPLIQVGTQPVPTVEHGYQALKTIRPEDAMRILRARTPGEAKRLGRTVEMRLDFMRRRVDHMRALLRVKFGPLNPDLRRKLLDTGESILVEGNTWHDRFWGMCVCGKCKRTGQNILGRLLMQRRAEIREGKV